MLPSSKGYVRKDDRERARPARRINISSLKGQPRADMWAKIQAEQPALAEDLQGGACARIREAFSDVGVGVIVSMDEQNRIITDKPETAETTRKTKPQNRR